MVDEEYIIREEVWEKYGVFLDTDSDKKLVTELDLSNKNIADLKSLEKMSSLSKLELYKNQIPDLLPLSMLVRLEELGLGSNQITDLSPLAGVTNLEALVLDDNQISDDQKSMLKKALPKCKIDF